MSGSMAQREFLKTIRGKSRGADGIRHVKHVAFRPNFVKDEVKRDCAFEYCPTPSMTADVLTKRLVPVKFEEHGNNLRVFPGEVQDSSKRGAGVMWSLC